ncbi:hypothetical protein [Streptomyces sp. NPDC050416]|uniref:hypothetical protein n=1 Tax=Streptomyces sp. NPDC050416 TaxID=3365611 RepID=UPI0037938444
MSTTRPYSRTVLAAANETELGAFDCSRSVTMSIGPSLLRVDGAPPEIRRVLVARLFGHPAPAITAVTRAITSAA